MGSVPVSATIGQVSGVVKFIVSQCFKQTEAKNQENQTEGQGRDQRHRLQRVETAGVDQCHGDHRHQQAPESVLPLGRVRIVARGYTVHHQDAGVGRGDKENGNHHQGQRTEPFGKGEALEEREQQNVGLAHQCRERTVHHVAVYPDSTIAKDGHPQEDKQ